MSNTQSPARHTPGPWSYDPYSQHQFHIYSEDRMHLATVLKRHERGASIYDSAETLANARLIAAAPELLEALKACLAFYSIGDYPAKITIERFRMLIAKAEGTSEPQAASSTTPSPQGTT